MNTFTATIVSALMRISSSIIAITLACSIHGVAFAQTTNGSAASGSVLEPERTTSDIIAAIRSLTPGRVPLKLSQLSVNAQRQQAWESDVKNARERQAEHRTECREAMRRANRDTLMDRVRQCYRSDLLQEVNLLHKLSQYWSIVPSLDPAVRTAASGAIMSLSDAEMTIIDGIDAGLFTNVEQMEQAKKNLRTAYREPYWLHLFKLHADRELSWAVYMAKAVEDRIKLEPTPERAETLRTMALCLEASGQLFRSVKNASDRLIAGQNLAAARAMRADCQAMFTTLLQTESEENAQKSDPPETGK